MDVYYTYSYATGAWMTLQALPLIASPSLVVTLLNPEFREITTMETYLSRSLGFSLLTIGFLSVLLTGSVPLTSSFAEPAGTQEEDPTAPYALPTLMITMLYHAGSAFFCYVMWNELGSMAYGVPAVVGGALASIGVWCVLFASSDGRISRKTGADKRTSGFPFKNAEADKKKQKKRI